MRDVLLDLADDLSRGIVVEWLDPADVAHLDSAYNNRVLSRVLRSLLYSSLSLFDVSYSKGEKKLVRAMKRRLHLGSIRWDSSVPEDVWISIALTSCSCLDRLRVLGIPSSGMSDALLLPILCKQRRKESDAAINYLLLNLPIAAHPTAAQLLESLWSACINEEVEIAQEILVRGVDINGQSVDINGESQGATPAYMACQNGHTECLSLLVNHGALLDKANNEGATPAFIA